MSIYFKAMIKHFKAVIKFLTWFLIFAVLVLPLLVAFLIVINSIRERSNEKMDIQG